MPIAPADEIEKMIEKRIRESSLEHLSSDGATGPIKPVDPPVDDPGIYKHVLKDPENESPHSIYFFYMRVNENGALCVDHYFYFDGPPDDPKKWARIPYGKVEEKIAYLAQNGRPSSTRNPIPLADHNFEKIIFRRRSYVAFFLDEANWSFHRRQAQLGRYAMVFNETKAKAKNYSFFDAMDLSFEMDNSTGGQSKRTGVVLINHMIGSDGKPLGPNDKQDFHFDMYFDVAFATPNNQRLVVVFDPTGTNQGPPEQP